MSAGAKKFDEIFLYKKKEKLACMIQSLCVRNVKNESKLFVF